MLDRSKADLVSRLRSVGPNDQRVQPTVLRAMLAQVDGAHDTLRGHYQKHLSDISSEAARLGARHGVDEFKHLSKHFTGTEPVLGLDRAAVFEGLVSGVDSSLLRRHERISRTWTNQSIDRMEKSLSVSAMTGKSLMESVDHLMKTEGISERYRAERIVRTEMAHAHGATKHAALQKLKEEEPDLLQIWLEPGIEDDRVGDDSLLLHGQRVPIGEPFTWRHKEGGAWVTDEVMHGPNRPNDRSTIVAWDPSWDEEDEEKALTIAELHAAPPTRWRKKVGVSVPSGHIPGMSYDASVREDVRDVLKKAKTEEDEEESSDSEEDDGDE